MTPLKIPHHWTSEQAFVVFDLIDRLRDQILVHYEHEIVGFLKQEHDVEFKTQSGMEDDNEDLPF